MRICATGTQGMKIQEGLVQVLLQGQGNFHGLLGFTPLILRWLLHREYVSELGFHPSPS
ncbi:hypothetical protein I79_016643 [Cricetulus griseus]|uniref:Uncharacterized protein n=1 Tax=Cricetulus griseus TaxID=10029 RepID=G3HZX9_CRIGR|nr:hypothetical protein I79_016643 [Cricetulus griseus]